MLQRTNRYACAPYRCFNVCVQPVQYTMEYLDLAPIARVGGTVNSPARRASPTAHCLLAALAEGNSEVRTAGFGRYATHA